MSQSTATCERYLTQKELVAALEADFGLRVSMRYIQFVKAESISRNDGLFVANRARASEAFLWIKSNPRFTTYRPSIS